MGTDIRDKWEFGFFTCLSIIEALNHGVEVAHKTVRAVLSCKASSHEKHPPKQKNN